MNEVVRHGEAMGKPNGCIFEEVYVGPIRLLLQKTLQEQKDNKSNCIIEPGRGDFAFFEVNANKVFVAMNMKNHPHHNGILDFIKSMNPGMKIENIVLGNYEFTGKNITLSQRYANAIGGDLTSIQSFLASELGNGFDIQIQNIGRDFGDKTIN